MLLVQIAVLAVVQGVAEFLPISSSGHVLVLAALFDQLGHPLERKLTVNIVLHVGTLVAVLVFYWGRVRRLVGEDRRVIALLAVGSVPAAVVGLPLRSLAEPALESSLLAGAMFPLTGGILIWAAAKPPGKLTCRQLSYSGALFVGVFQSFAILPGISRSGATIAAGLASGLSRQEAAAFSFLLAIPAIGGAGLVELINLLQQPEEAGSLAFLGLGAGLSFAVGLVSLAWLIRWLDQGRLHYFAWWVLVLGPAVILWQLWLS